MTLRLDDQSILRHTGLATPLERCRVLWLCVLPGTMHVMQWPPAQDQTVYVTIGPSGGRSHIDQVARVPGTGVEPAQQTGLLPIKAVYLIGDAIFRSHAVRTGMLSDIGRQMIHWVVFRGGWTVYVDAPGRDPIKLRCANRAAAQARAAQLVDEIEAYGGEALDRLPG